MNLTQKTLISLLSAAIRGKKVESLYLEDINWREVLEEAKAHEVYTLIYPLIKDIFEKYNIDKTLIAEWKNTTVLSGIRQVSHIKQLKKVFENFKEEDIPVIALKGLVIREYYPHPELRSMSDADILIHKEDNEKAATTLTNLGYYKFSSIPIHSSFMHKKHLAIDLHWSLVDELHIKTISDFNDTLWENTRITNIYDVPILSLSKEYELLHLLLHIASHMIKSGFGLRQLCDVVVFVENERNNIDWGLFFEKVKAYQIEKLVMTIFIVCKELFSMDLPNQDNVNYFAKNSYIKLFINQIFSSGVFGNRDHIRSFSTKLLHQNYNKADHSSTKFSFIISFLFPTQENLIEKYSYAKKYPFLITFAWIHRIFFELFSNGYTHLKQVPNLYSTAAIAKERLRLLRWLQL